MKEKILAVIGRFFLLASKFPKADRKLYLLFSPLLYKSSTSQISKKLMDKEYKSMSVFLRETGFNEDSHDLILQKVVFTSWIRYLWRNRLEQTVPLRVEGLENLNEAKNSGRGIIVLRSHQRLGRALSKWLYKNLDISMAVGQSRRSLRKSIGRDKKFSQVDLSIAFARDLLLANKVLLQGGVVEMAPDGKFGSKFLTYDFFNRQRAFKVGFAELALMADCMILPVSINIEGFSTLVIKIWPATFPDKAKPDDEEIKRLTEFYVNYLANCWSDTPHMIAHNHLRKHLKFFEKTQ